MPVAPGISEQLTGEVASLQRSHWRRYSAIGRTEFQSPVVEVSVAPQRAGPETVGGEEGSLTGSAPADGAATRHASATVATATGQRHPSSEFLPRIGPCLLA